MYLPAIATPEFPYTGNSQPEKVRPDIIFPAFNRQSIFFVHATCWMSYNENMEEEFAAHSVYKTNSSFFVQHIETLFSAKDYRSIVLEKEINVTLY